MSVLFWALVIPGAIITYFVVGVMLNILMCVFSGDDWRRELPDEDTLPLIIFWPFVLIAVVFVFLPMSALQWVLEKLAGGEEK